MYTDPAGMFAISVLISGFIIGALISGVVETGKQIYFNGWNPSDWNWGSIFNKTLVGGALGLAGAAGVVFLGPVVAGTAAVGAGKTALIAFGATTAISFVTGAGGYAIEKVFNNEDVSLKNLFSQGALVALESMWSFGIGGIVGSVGNVGKKGQSLKSIEWWAKLAVTQEFTYPFKYLIDVFRREFFS